MERADRFVLVLVTVPVGEEAEKLAHSLVVEKLAACVNRIGPVQSVYKWQGEIETSDEELLMIKSDIRHLERLEAHVMKNHPYEVPEILALPIGSGAPPYLAWLSESLAGS